MPDTFAEGLILGLALGSLVTLAGVVVLARRMYAGRRGGVVDLNTRRRQHPGPRRRS